MGTMLSGGEGIALDRFEGTSPRSPSIRNDLNADSGFDRGELSMLNAVLRIIGP